MSRRKKNLRAFLYQNSSATIEQAWDAAWEGAQKLYHSISIQEREKQINDLQSQLSAEREANKGLREALDAIRLSMEADGVRWCRKIAHNALSAALSKVEGKQG